MSCRRLVLFVKGAANSTQPASREELSFAGQKEGVKLKSTQHTTTMALHFHLRVSVTCQVRWVVRFPRSRVVVVTLVRGVSGPVVRTDNVTPSQREVLVDPW